MANDAVEGVAAQDFISPLGWDSLVSLQFASTSFPLQVSA